ncbi:cation:proton antiporter domain-containing protein [Alteromonas sp. ASW11-130]|uniref:cation:proton antiporter domain-containing protein n=1 Tax=Alteromonas sp. ASW11-130 TaxID=3015775 RepID=UPI002241A4A9|nr:cation:proton antiporter [Alteromonas sp. ASW11-130]MCW8091124.1 cation:proton antiporter [Alteromonas sp. ASW11-130]
MEQLNIVLTVVGGTVLLFGMFSRVINRSLVTIPMLAFFTGIILGPLGIDVLDPESWGDTNKILMESARITLGISLMAIALRIPKNYLFTQRRSLTIILGIGMPCMFLISSALAHWMFGVPFILAMLIGATISPTDPVVASSIVTGGLAKAHLPEQVRNGLSAESALNDGLAYPFAIFPLLFLDSTLKQPLFTGVIKVVGWEVGGGVLLGILLGWGTGKALLMAEKKKSLDHSAFLATTLALTLAILGLAELCNTNSVLAVFIGGVAFSKLVKGSERAKENKIQETVNLFFTLPIFILFGLMLPVEKWVELGGVCIAFIITIFLLRRIPVILTIYRLTSLWKGWKTALLCGHFGPMGISALFYSMLVVERGGYEIIWTVGSLVVAASIIIHGISVTPIVRHWQKT